MCFGDSVSDVFVLKCDVSQSLALCYPLVLFDSGNRCAPVLSPLNERNMNFNNLMLIAQYNVVQSNTAALAGMLFSQNTITIPQFLLTLSER